MKLILPLLFILLSLISCKNDDVSLFTSDQQKEIVLDELYVKFKDGDIQECTFGDDLVYCCSVSDTSDDLYFYEKDGSFFAECKKSGITLDDDPFCQDITLYQCRYIYRSPNHRLGFLNEFDLGK